MATSEQEEEDESSELSSVEDDDSDDESYGVNVAPAKAKIAGRSRNKRKPTTKARGLHKRPRLSPNVTEDEEPKDGHQSDSKSTESSITAKGQTPKKPT